MRRRGWGPVAILVLVSLFLAYPLYALFEFSVRFPLTGKVSFDAWAKLFGGTDGRAILHDGTQNLQLAKGQHLPVSVLSA